MDVEVKPLNSYDYRFLQLEGMVVVSITKSRAQIFHPLPVKESRARIWAGIHVNRHMAPNQIEGNIQGSAEARPTSTVTAFPVLSLIELRQVLYSYSAFYVHVPSLCFQFAPTLSWPSLVRKLYL